MTLNRNQWAATGLCAALLVLCVALSHPVADVGIADDFSYATSAEVLARTGHVVYNGWSTAMLGWQLYWGALFYRLFGYTWFAIRLSGLTVAVLTAGLMHRISLRCGLTARNAVLGTLTVVLSPLFLPLAYSFMSDVFGLFALLVSLYCCLRALEDFERGRSSRVLVGWLALAMVSSVVLGTTRQISWIGTLTLMPTAAWMMRRRRGVITAGAVLWVLGAAGVAGLLHWFQMQPYSLRESFFAEKVSLASIAYFLSNVAGGSFELPFLILPVTLGFLFYVPWHKRRTRVLGVLMSAGAWFYVFIRLHQHVLRGSLLPTLPGVLTDRGMWFISSVELEWWPVVLGLVPRLVVSALTFAAVFAVCAVLLDFKSKPNEETGEEWRRASTLSLRTLLILTWPTMAAYTFLLLSRTMFALLFDRYMPLLMVLLAILGLRYAQRWPQRRPQWLAAVVISCLALYGIAAMHDLFALYRARLVAVANLRHEGIARTSIHGGFEYNGSTEIEAAGHINLAILNPRSAYVHVPIVKDWRDEAFPHIKALYEVNVAPAGNADGSIRPVVPVGNVLGPALVITTRQLP